MPYIQNLDAWLTSQPDLDPDDCGHGFSSILEDEDGEPYCYPCMIEDRNERRIQAAEYKRDYGTSDD